MWNLISGNASMNKFERLMNHKGHLERLAQSKKVIKTKQPKIPSFISKKKRNMGTKIEKALKICYQNKVLYNKMYEIQHKLSPYSKQMNVPSRCPAFESLKHNNIRRKIYIKNENNKLYVRFANAKPTYNILSLLNGYEYNKYLENNISQNNNRTNPNLDFVSFEKFNNIIRNKSFINKTKRKLYLMNKNFNSSNDILYNKNSNKRRNKYISLKNLDYNEISHNLKDYNNEINKLKLNRPNSCKPNFITINRDLKDNSDILSSIDKVNNISYKTSIKKPSSGKARTNVSNSTKALTSI